MSTTIDGILCHDWADVDNGLCTPTELWTPIPTAPDPASAPEPAAPEPFNIEDVPAKRLRRDVMKVYHQLGGHQYLHTMATKDPAQFNKLLMKVLPQTIEADVRAEVATRGDLRALSTETLKQMLLDQLRATSIDVTPTGDPTGDPNPSLRSE